jgi:glyoxylase-like metal-dependent hydrolase (beta-lactamase superfamily II)
MRSTVTRLEVGGFELPQSITGTVGERVVVNAWVVRHPEATLLVDTGIGEHVPEDDVREMRFVRTPIAEALGAIGVGVDEVDLLINCHLHVDHAGGNVAFRGTPILVQAAELDAARGPDYTVAEDVDLTEGRYEVRDGEHEPLPGVRVFPTPGHSPGHQSVAVDTPDGRLILAGQVFRAASDFARALTSYRLSLAGFEHAGPWPGWMPRMLELEPYRIAFGHDLAVWQRDA